MFLCQNFLCENKTYVVYIPISLDYQDLQDLTPFNVTSYISTVNIT